MSRRVVFLIALISLAVLGTAASPWTLPGGGLSAELKEHVRSRYGLDMTVRGRSTFAVLPIPRVKFEDVVLEFPDGALKAEGGTLRGELRILPLLFGRIDLSDFDLTEPASPPRPRSSRPSNGRRSSRTARLKPMPAGWW
jgi:AsmA protein